MFTYKIWSFQKSLLYLCPSFVRRFTSTQSLRNIRINVLSLKSKRQILQQFKYDKNTVSLLQKRWPKPLWCFNIVTVMLWLGLIEENDANVSPLVMTIKRGILCMQRQEYDKAEIILHSALKLAQELVFEEAETYIFDILANNAYQKGDYANAEKLFINVLSRILSNGKAQQNDESVVEISLKLSMIYSKRGDVIKANEGFKFCFHSQQKRVNDLINRKSDTLNDTEINSLLLWGMCLDMRAKHLTTIGKYKDAINDYKNALKLCKELNGDNHLQTLVLLNDIATVYVLLNDFETAIKYFKKAIDGGIRVDSDDLSIYYYNLGSLYLNLMNFNAAQFACRESLNLSMKVNNKEVEEKSRECINKSRNF